MLVSTTVSGVSFDATDAPALRLASDDRALCRMAAQVQQLTEALADRLTARHVLAVAVAQARASGTDAGAVLAEQAASLRTALDGLKAGFREVDDALGADARERMSLDGACSVRARWVETAIASIPAQLAGMRSAEHAQHAALSGQGLTSQQVRSLLDANGTIEERTAKLLEEREGYLIERAVIADFASDPLRDRAKLGKLLPVVLAVGERTNSDFTLLREWAIMGPVDLREKAEV